MEDSRSVMSGGELAQGGKSSGNANRTMSMTVNPSRIWMEGYLTKKGTPKGLSKDPWSRRYFVIKVIVVL